MLGMVQLPQRRRQLIGHRRQFGDIDAAAFLDDRRAGAMPLEHAESRILVADGSWIESWIQRRPAPAYHMPAQV